MCVEKVDRQLPRTSGGRLLSEVGADAAFASLLPPQNGLFVKSCTENENIQLSTMSTYQPMIYCSQRYILCMSTLCNIMDMFDDREQFSHIHFWELDIVS